MFVFHFYHMFCFSILTSVFFFTHSMAKFSLFVCLIAFLNLPGIRVTFFYKFFFSLPIFIAFSGKTAVFSETAFPFCDVKQIFKIYSGQKDHTIFFISIMQFSAFLFFFFAIFFQFKNGLSFLIYLVSQYIFFN